MQRDYTVTPYSIMSQTLFRETLLHPHYNFKRLVYKLKKVFMLMKGRV